MVSSTARLEQFPELKQMVREFVIGPSQCDFMMHRGTSWYGYPNFQAQNVSTRGCDVSIRATDGEGSRTKAISLMSRTIASLEGLCLQTARLFTSQSSVSFVFTPDFRYQPWPRVNLSMTVMVAGMGQEPKDHNCIFLLIYKSEDEQMHAFIRCQEPAVEDKLSKLHNTLPIAPGLWYFPLGDIDTSDDTLLRAQLDREKLYALLQRRKPTPEEVKTAPFLWLLILKKYKAARYFPMQMTPWRPIGLVERFHELTPPSYVMVALAFAEPTTHRNNMLSRAMHPEYRPPVRRRLRGKQRPSLP